MKYLSSSFFFFACKMQAMRNKTNNVIQIPIITNFQSALSFILKSFVNIISDDPSWLY